MLAKAPIGAPAGSLGELSGYWLGQNPTDIRLGHRDESIGTGPAAVATEVMG